MRSDRLVVVLRAINVGGHKVKMERLRALFAELGFGRVETLIASGNVLFDLPDTPARKRGRGGADTLEPTIEAHLHAALGYDVTAFVRSADDVQRIAAHEWDAKVNGGERQKAVTPTTIVGFLKTTPGPDVMARVAALNSETDHFRFAGRELYWLCRTHLGESRMAGGLLEKTLGMPMTMRNITTVRKLAARCAPPP